MKYLFLLIVLLVTPLATALGQSQKSCPSLILRRQLAVSLLKQITTLDDDSNKDLRQDLVNALKLRIIDPCKKKDIKIKRTDDVTINFETPQDPKEWLKGFRARPIDAKVLYQLCAEVKAQLGDAEVTEVKDGEIQLKEIECPGRKHSAIVRERTE